MRFHDRPSFTIAFYLDSVPFTREVIEGRASLGGSESAAIAAANGLAARGHDIKIFARRLAEDCQHATINGVQWLPAETVMVEAMKLMRLDVFVSVRMPHVFAMRTSAKLNVLWGQDMLIQPISSWLAPVDLIAYVSDWQREQWQQVDPTLARIPSFRTTNAFNPDLVPAPTNRVLPTEAPRFIHISRPERGLDALLALWPKLRARWPQATLKLCRYSSMYDAGGWGRVCADYDRRVAAVNEAVGGIEYLGELGKAGLYQALSEADLMIYPTSQQGFAETNCLACTEAQANGLPFLGTWRGALPETLHPDAGRLLVGGPDAFLDEAFLDEWVRAAEQMLEPETHAAMSTAGRAHAQQATIAAVAEQWEQTLIETFARRFANHHSRVIDRLMNDDNHVLARTALEGRQDFSLVAQYEFCQRVIAGEDQTADDYGNNAIQDPHAEADVNQRFQKALDALKAKAPTLDRPLRFLDVACGNGAFLLAAAKAFPDASFTGLDYSNRVLSLARDVLPGVEFISGPWQETLGGLAAAQRTFDVVFCGEFLEHVEHPDQLITAIEAVTTPGGVIALTTPVGPWTELMPHGVPVKRGHLYSYDTMDIDRLFGMKADVAWNYLDVGHTPKGNAVGFWVVCYRHDADALRTSLSLIEPAYQWRKILTERPYTRIHAALIMRDNQDTILRCLQSLYGVIDRVVIYDTGSTDKSIALAEEWGATVVRGEWPDDFSVARNRSLALAEPGADYVLWIDTDEWLEGGANLRQFATLQSPFKALAVKQHHFHVDKPNDHDRPCRIIRTGEGIQFYGVVHEQPETALDKGIVPALLLETTAVLHIGYHSGYVRTSKMRDRNLALLERELAGEGTHPPRRLAWLLLMRDYVNFAGLDMVDRQAEHPSPQGVQWLAQCVKIYQQMFSDPSDIYHQLAWGFYQDALRLSRSPNVIQIAWSFGAAAGQLRGKPALETFRVLSPDEGESVVTRKTSAWMASLKGPSIVCPDPVVPVPDPREPVAA